MPAKIQTHRDLQVYQMAFDAAKNLFELSKSFPKEETYALTDQMRRSSRSVCANLAEAWRKRRYQNAFVSKICDSEGEAAETQVWIEFKVGVAFRFEMKEGVMKITPSHFLPFSPSHQRRLPRMRSNIRNRLMKSR